MAESFCNRPRNAARLRFWQAGADCDIDIYISISSNSTVASWVGEPAEMGFRGGRAAEKEGGWRVA